MPIRVYSTVREQDLESEIRETQKLPDAIDNVGAKLESILVDTSVMNAPATAFCSLANRLIKENSCNCW